uniref:Sulfotransferase n=2 Tax=Clytia hemisphaerica TaxID=252671 RepID=A0A7M5XE27_9CNID
ILVSLWQIYLYISNKRKEKADLTKKVQDAKAGDIAHDNEAFEEFGVNVGKDNIIKKANWDKNNQSTSASNVFFLIGCQRSGSNWLHTMITDSETIATPHPPHILKHFMPILHKFGDLSIPLNLQRLINLICEFVEKNPVPWLDEHGEKIKFDREVVYQQCESTDVPLVAIFGSLMNEFTVKNGRKTWVCKSVSYGKFHKELSQHFGDRLRYIYLYRDPRDVCLSSYKASQIANSHYYTIAQTWKKLQLVAINLTETLTSQQVHQLSYESLLADKKTTLDELFDFMNTENTTESSTHAGKEAALRAKKSSLWKNLTRGESLRTEQMKKWAREGGLSTNDVKIIESICKDVMQKLGYMLEYEGELPEFSEEEIKEFERLNEEGKARKKIRLAEEDPDDHQRRITQEEVLQKISSSSYDIDVESHQNTPSSKPPSFWADAKQQLWPLRPIMFWIVLAGFVSGFLGGLIGVRGPPLIILFFFFEYPKSQIKANGAIVASINVIIRIITYAVKSPPEKYPSKTWFTDADKYLYISVALSGLLATPIGF